MPLSIHDFSFCFLPHCSRARLLFILFCEKQLFSWWCHDSLARLVKLSKLPRAAHTIAYIPSKQSATRDVLTKLHPPNIGTTLVGAMFLHSSPLLASANG
jgi:hypothetical protein